MDEKIILAKSKEGYLLTNPISDEDAGENGAVIAFDKPFGFEGTTYTGVDTSCLDGLTGADLTAINNHLNRLGNPAPVKEIDYAFLTHALARAADAPIEFFEALPAKSFAKVMRRAQNYFFGEV